MHIITGTDTEMDTGTDTGYDGLVKVDTGPSCHDTREREH